MPSFRRNLENSITYVLAIDPKKFQQGYSPKRRKSFVQKLKMHRDQGKKQFLYIQFEQNYSLEILDALRKETKEQVDFIGVDLYGFSWRSLFSPLPQVDHCTWIFPQQPSLLTNLFLRRLDSQATKYTILQYVDLRQADEIIEKFRAWSKRYSNLEIVLHPTEESAKEASHMAEALKEDGYFEPSDLEAFEFSKPEKVRINYKYSDVELSPREIKLRGLNQFQGFHCLAGVEHFCIDVDGLVTSSSCGWVEEKGVPMDEDFERKQAFVCPAETCQKSDDILISKIDPSELSPAQ